MTLSAPSAAALVRTLVRHHFTCSLPAAAVFLASPVGCVPGSAAGADDSGMWVGDARDDFGATVRDIAATAARLGAAAEGPDVAYLDLDGDPAAWVKLMRSGWRTVAFGPDLLWGTPRVALEGDLDQDAAVAFVTAWRSDPAMTYPALLPGQAGRPAVLVDGSSRRVVLRGPQPAAGPAVDGPLLPAVTAAEDIAARVGGQLRRLARSPVDLAWSVTLEVPELGTAVVRFTVHSGSYQLLRRARPGGPVPEAAAGLPAGFTRVRVGPLTCLLHQPSGVVTEPIPAGH